MSDPTTETPGNTPDGPGTSRRRRLIAAIAALAVLVVAGVVAFLLVRGDDGTTSPTADESSAPTTTTAPATESVIPPPPTPTPTGPTENADALPPALPDVPIDGTAEVGNGISATIARTESIQGGGQGPGNVAGPAVRVTIRITNGTPEAVSLDLVAVNMFYGSDLTPASPLDDPSQAPFSGTVAPGESGEGVYVFSLPSDARNDVTIEVGYQAGAPLLHFRGPVA
jgi:hypothetical protein